MQVDEVGTAVKRNLRSFLSKKPMWVFWVAYTVLSGIIFSVFYAAMYMMARQWWIPVVAVLGIGVVWGSFVFTNEPKEIHETEA